MKGSVFQVFGLMLLLFLASCQKEMSLETEKQAIGTLRDDVSGECLPKQIGGEFMAGQALTDSNYIEVNVEVTEPGFYRVYTDSVNGYSFEGSGTFSTTGPQRIQLTGSGEPLQEGVNEFTVYFGSSYCVVLIDVLSDNSDVEPAAFTLEGAGAGCTDAGVSGPFVKGTELTSASSLIIKINATTTGSYDLSTNTVNGFLFSGSGIISSTGPQTLTLTATGTPAEEGVHTFTVFAGTASCTFPVTVTASEQPPLLPGHGYLFPLTQDSWWSYGAPDQPEEDTILLQNTLALTEGGISYHGLEFTAGSEPFDTLLVRREGNDYYTYASGTDFVPTGLDEPVYGELLFLKDSARKGETWNSATFQAKVMGVPVSARVVFTCTDDNATVTLRGKEFTGVYKVTHKAQVSTPGAPFADQGPVFERYYVRGVGMIYEKETFGQLSEELVIRNWQVN